MSDPSRLDPGAVVVADQVRVVLQAADQAIHRHRLEERRQSKAHPGGEDHRQVPGLRQWPQAIDRLSRLDVVRRDRLRRASQSLQHRLGEHLRTGLPEVGDPEEQGRGALVVVQPLAALVVRIQREAVRHAVHELGGHQLEVHQARSRLCRGQLQPREHSIGARRTRRSVVVSQPQVAEPQHLCLTGELAGESCQPRDQSFVEGRRREPSDPVPEIAPTAWPVGLRANRATDKPEPLLLRRPCHLQQAQHLDREQCDHQHQPHGRHPPAAEARPGAGPGEQHEPGQAVDEGNQTEQPGQWAAATRRRHDGLCELGSRRLGR